MSTTTTTTTTTNTTTNITTTASIDHVVGMPCGGRVVMFLSSAIVVCGVVTVVFLIAFGVHHSVLSIYNRSISTLH